MLRNIQEGVWLSRINQVIDKARTLAYELKTLLLSNYQTELMEGPNPQWALFKKDSNINKLVHGLSKATENKKLNSLEEVSRWLDDCEKIQLTFAVAEDDNQALKKLFDSFKELKIELVYLKNSGLNFIDSVIYMYSHFLAEMKEEAFARSHNKKYYSKFHQDQILSYKDRFNQIFQDEYVYLTGIPPETAKKVAELKSENFLVDMCEQVTQAAIAQIERLAQEEQETHYLSQQDFLHQTLQAKEDFLLNKIFEQYLVKLDWIFLKEQNNFNKLSKSDQEKYLLIYCIMSQFADHLAFMEKNLFWEYYFTEKNQKSSLERSLNHNVHDWKQSWYEQCYFEKKIKPLEAQQEERRIRSNNPLHQFRYAQDIYKELNTKLKQEAKEAEQVIKIQLEQQEQQAEPIEEHREYLIPLDELNKQEAKEKDKYENQETEEEMDPEYYRQSFNDDNYLDPLNTLRFAKNLMELLPIATTSTLDVKELLQSIKDEFVKHVSEDNFCYAEQKEEWYKANFLSEWRKRILKHQNQLVGTLKLALKMLEKNQQNKQDDRLALKNQENQSSDHMNQTEKQLNELITKIENLVNPPVYVPFKKTLSSQLPSSQPTQSKQSSAVTVGIKDSQPKLEFSQVKPEATQDYKQFFIANTCPTETSFKTETHSQKRTTTTHGTKGLKVYTFTH